MIYFNNALFWRVISVFHDFCVPLYAGFGRKSCGILSFLCLKNAVKSAFDPLEVTKNPGTQWKTCWKLNFKQGLFRMLHDLTTLRPPLEVLNTLQTPQRSIAEQALQKDPFEPNFTLILLVNQKEKRVLIF